MPASRTGYAYVRVNGSDYGVYLNVETLDDVSLPRWFASTGHLYEGTYPRRTSCRRMPRTSRSTRATRTTGATSRR